MYRYIVDKDEAIAAALEIKEYTKSIENPLLGLDLETYSKWGFQPRPILRPDGTYEGNISLFQIGLDPRKLDTQYIFDIKSLGEKLITELFAGWLEDVMILGQNLKYDWGFVYKQLKIRLKKMRDTMLISQVVNAGNEFISHSLPGLCDFFFGNELYNWFKDETGFSYTEYFQYKKNLQSSDWSKVLTNEQLKYAADDVRLIFYLYEAQKKYLAKFIEKYKIDGIYDVIKLECNLIPVFSMMELRGVDFDEVNHREFVIPYLESLSEEYRGEVAKFFSRQVRERVTVPFTQSTGKVIQKTIGYEDKVECINLNSWQQIKEALRPYLGEDWYKSKGGTDENTLVHYVDCHPSVPYILKYKKVAKCLSTYGYNLIEPLMKNGKVQLTISKTGHMQDLAFLHEDGRFHPQWFQIGADEDSVGSGRSSCKAPNLMAQPARGKLGTWEALKLMRGSYKVPKGRKWISADVSNGEVRLMAQKTKDPILLDALNHGKDMHAITAKEVLDLPELPNENSDERRVGKQTFLSLQYMMGIGKYQSDILKHTGLVWSWEESQLRRNKFLGTYTGIKEAQDFQRMKVERALAPYITLSDFGMDKNGRREIFIERTPMGRPRSWFLTDRQEQMCRDERRKLLAKNFEILQDDGRYSTFGNEFNSRSHEIVRESFNHPVQGALADIIKMAMVEIEAKLRDEGFPDDEGIISQIHDEINLEVAEERVELAAKITHDAMYNAARKIITVVPVVVKTGQGEKWSEAK